MFKKTTKKRKLSLKRVKNWLLGIVGLTVILLAISFTLIRVAIKYVPDYATSIQDAVSEELDIKLEVDVVDAEIYWLVPRLNLYNVKVFDKSGKKLFLQADEVDLSLDWVNTIRTMIPAISEITLDGINISVGINKNNQLLIQDYVVNENIETVLDVTNQNAGSMQLNLIEDFLSEELQFVINNLDFKILNSQLRFYDERDEKRNKTINQFNLRLLNGGDEHKFEMQAALPKGYGNYVHVVMDVEGDLFDYKNLFGELYVSVDNIKLAPWLDDYWNSSGVAINANIFAQYWLSWEELDITNIEGHFNLKNAGIHYLGKKVNTWKLDQLDGRMKWLKKSEGWQLDVRDLTSVRKGGHWPTPTAATIKMSDKNQQVQMQANFLRIEGLSYLAGMANSFLDESIPWIDMLDKHQPSGDLHNLDVSFPLKAPQDIRVNTEFNHISFSLPGNEPSAIKNLQGSIIYLDKKTWLALETTDAQLEFNKLMRNSIDLTSLRGVLEIAYIDERLSISSNSLVLDTPHISTESRFDFSLYENKPFLDLTTQYKNGNVKYTSLYLPAEIMDKDTLSWLDRAILSGYITEGGYQIYGDLTDFPFAQREGVSIADFNVQSIDLSYLKKWPRIDDLSANLRLENDSLTVKATEGKVFESNLVSATAYIDNFQSPALDLTGKIEVNLSDIPRYLKQSVLANNPKSYINNVELSGDGMLDLELFIPLVDNSHVEWGGGLVTQNGGVKFVKEGYSLSDLNASVRFADGFFEGSSILANFDGKPVNIDLTTISNSISKIYSFDVQGKLSAQSLLSPLPELKKYFKGSSDWNISIDLAQDKFTKTSQLNVALASNLEGVSSSLPGPMHKAASENALLKVNILKKAAQHMQYNLRLGNDKRLDVEEFDKYWLYTADVPSVKGSVNISKASESLTPVKVDLEYFDIDAFLKSSGESAGDVDGLVPRDIPAIEFKSKKLSWNKFRFNQVEAITRQTKLGMVVDKYRLVSDNYTLAGKGNWYSGWNKQHTTGFEFDASINNLGNAFKELGLSNDLKDTQGSAHMRLKWPASPYGFSWEVLQGDGRFSLKDGTITQVDVGAGRVLGLFNLTTILSLDFANQVSDGFTFDKAQGSLSFSEGSAFTDDMVIESKVADLFINGELNIKQASVDQTIRVRPHVESTVALGTAVIAGPTVGGLVYLFQKLFTPDKLSDYEYSVKGKIEDPVIELLSAPADDLSEDEDDEDSDY